MSKEIKDKIAALFEEYNSLFDPTTFVLNPRLIEIQGEIMELQRKCKHNFVNGYCEYCTREE
jgi:ribosomal protein S17E